MKWLILFSLVVIQSCESGGGGSEVEKGSINPGGNISTDSTPPASNSSAVPNVVEVVTSVAGTTYSVPFEVVNGECVYPDKLDLVHLREFVTDSFGSSAPAIKRVFVRFPCVKPAGVVLRMNNTTPTGGLHNFQVGQWGLFVSRTSSTDCSTIDPAARTNALQGNFNELYFNVNSNAPATRSFNGQCFLIVVRDNVESIDAEIDIQ